MKITHKTDRMDITVEGVDVKTCFDELACAMEVLGETRCGACDCTDIRFQTREAKGFQFREAQCRECGCALAFGQRKADGALYPRRKDEDGNWLDNRGWVKFRREESSSPF